MSVENKINDVFKKELFLLQIFYKKLCNLLELYFSGYLILSDDALFKSYLKLCFKVENILQKKGFEEIRNIEWRPFENLRSLDPDAPDLDWELHGRNLCGDFLSEIERLYIESGENSYDLIDETLAFLDNADLIMKNYRDYKIKYEKNWEENMKIKADKFNEDLKNERSKPIFNSNINSDLDKFRQLYYRIDKVSKYHGEDPIFKLTTKGSQSLTDLIIPYSEREFKEFIENLFVIVYEGSGSGKRLPLKLDQKRTLTKLKELRNHFVHDQEHGNPSEIRRKHKLIGNIFHEIIGTKAPSKDEHWSFASSEILKRINVFLSLIIENYSKLENYYEKDESPIKHRHDPDITIFPEEKTNFRIMNKKNEFHGLADATIFIPHFSLSWVPQYGPINAAIHFLSSAYYVKMQDYKKFLNRIEKIWEKRIPYKARDTRDFFSWSISGDGKMKVGSGVNNLINAIESTDIGMITIFLIGAYGEDYSKTFFIIISNYWKYGIFRDNYLDIYLSNIPLDFKWIEEINESLKVLSPNCEIADSYSLKEYGYHFWRSEKKFEVSKNLIGGIGRDGFDEDREWDQFTGLILKNPFTEGDFTFDEESSFNLFDSFSMCPTDAFDELVMSVTNSPPTYDEIMSGKFIGFNRPHIQHFIFDGHGHTIHALLFWGWAIYDKSKETNFMVMLDEFKIKNGE